jgi:acyl carrier protein
MNYIIKLRNIFRDIFDDESMAISEFTMREDIEDWDSVAHIKLVLAIEDDFGIRLSMEEMSAIKSVSEFITAIHRHDGK